MAEELIFLGFLAIGASSVGEVNLDLLEGWLATDWVISKSLGFGLKVTSGLRLITAVSSSSNTFGLGVLDDLLTPVSVSSIDRLSCSLSFVWAFCSCDFDRFFCGKKDGEKSSSPANSLLRLVVFRWDIGSKVFQSTWWGKIQRKHKKDNRISKPPCLSELVVRNLGPTEPQCMPFNQHGGVLKHLNFVRERIRLTRFSKVKCTSSYHK